MASSFEAKRQAQKEVNRSSDAEAVGNGQASVAEIQRKNAIFAQPGVKISFERDVPKKP